MTFGGRLDKNRISFDSSKLDIYVVDLSVA